MEFAKKVRGLLKTKGLSQTDLASAIGTNQQQISRWLEGNSPPKAGYLLRMARTLGVTADYLIDDDQDEPPGPAITEDERAVLDLYHALGLDRREAMKRLATSALEASKGAAKIIGVRDETEFEIRRQNEIIARLTAERRSKRLADVNCEDEGADVT